MCRLVPRSVSLSMLHTVFHATGRFHDLISHTLQSWQGLWLFDSKSARLRSKRFNVVGNRLEACLSSTSRLAIEHATARLTFRTDVDLESANAYALEHLPSL